MALRPKAYSAKAAAADAKKVRQEILLAASLAIKAASKETSPQDGEGAANMASFSRTMVVKAPQPVISITTDADEAITLDGASVFIIHSGALTADRLLTLPDGEAGSTVRVTRTGPGKFKLSVGSLKSLATNSWCDAVYDGSAWVLTAHGTL